MHQLVKALTAGELASFTGYVTAVHTRQAGHCPSADTMEAAGQLRDCLGKQNGWASAHRRSFRRFFYFFPQVFCCALDYGSPACPSTGYQCSVVIAPLDSHA